MITDLTTGTSQNVNTIYIYAYTGPDSDQIGPDAAAVASRRHS